MTKEKEKAIDLIAKVEIELADIRVYRGTVKKLALIAVDEVINSMTVATSVHLPYWQQVKHEIENL
jgi:energy-converting hydrogenase Eha subunit G